MIWSGVERNEKIWLVRNKRSETNKNLVNQKEFLLKYN